MFVVAARGQSRGYQIENLGWWFSKCLVSGPLKLLTVTEDVKEFLFMWLISINVYYQTDQKHLRESESC